MELLLRAQLHLFFLALLPFVVFELALAVIPVCIATAFVLIGAEALAVQLEVPFGRDANDLPLETYCLTLEADLLDLLQESDAASASQGGTLTPPPGQRPPPAESAAAPSPHQVYAHAGGGALAPAS